MPRYVAFLRGVSPQNARMPALKQCFEAAGFEHVRTVLSSGNVVFDARARPVAVLEARAEASLQQGLGRSFFCIVRPVAALAELLEADPFAKVVLPPEAKRVVSFLRQPPPTTLALPIESDGARILQVVGAEVFTAYVPSPKGPVFMTLIDKAFGTAVTTRTWDTVRKCAGA